MTVLPYRFGVVGGGWRSEFYLRLARDLPDQFEITGLYSRSAEHREEVAHRFGIPTAESLSEVATQGNPDFVLVAVPVPAAAELTIELVSLGARVLTETPPAFGLDGMRHLWSEVGAQRRVQVGDQTIYMPSVQARRTIIDSGVIGEVTSVHVSSNHQYHAVSMMRGLMRVGKGATTVSAQDFVADLVDPIIAKNPTDNPDATPHTTCLASIDFGDGKSGLYDFTFLQWFNPLRQRRLLIRGSHGEIHDDKVIYMEDTRTVIESLIHRRQLGIDLNLEGYRLDNITFNGRAVFRNPFTDASQSDEDIAAGEVVRRTALWARDEGPAPYPLADGLQDHHIGLAFAESVRAGHPVTTSVEEWSSAPSWFDED